MSNPTTASTDPGLLPTSLVNVQSASSYNKGDSRFLAGGDVYSTQVAGHHDASYYADWNRKRQEAVARGEDPNAEFIAMCKAREQRGYHGKIRRLFGKMKGSKPHGEPLSAEEEAKAKEKDGRGGDGVVR